MKSSAASDFVRHLRVPVSFSYSYGQKQAGKHEFSLIFPLYGVKLHEESKYFIRIFATRLYSSLFAARLYAKKCKTCVCAHQPELPSGHARATGIGWNHRFDDV